MKYIDLIRQRRSVRTFDGRKISEEDLNRIKEFSKTVSNPYGLDIEWCFLDSSKEKLNVPVIGGCDTYITGKMKNSEHANEAFGYSFEQIVLYAWSLGVGTTWIAGTMDRKAFERAIDLKDDEIMPCISPLGYAAEKMTFRETMMRKGLKADVRKDSKGLFFDEEFGVPLYLEDAVNEALEAVRLAPSAVNKQPWRIIRQNNTFHFYKKPEVRNEGIIDVQKIDIGIALCHFQLVLKENGIDSKIVIEDPQISSPEKLEYIASCVI
ncbi:MAG: nitroreductase family protein [Erysipelotrichaceae bacterium]|nr:nitroreductase family protein [Erysipelotrichaceae bacterium]